MSKQRIYSTKSAIEVQGIQQKLQDGDISFEVIDKTDSSYASLFGYIEIFVESDDQVEAEKIIKNYLKD